MQAIQALAVLQAATNPILVYRHNRSKWKTGVEKKINLTNILKGIKMVIKVQGTQ